MSRLTISKNPFQALDHDYTRLLFSSLIDIQGHITQKLDFPLPQVSRIRLILFSLDWGNLNPFGPKRPREVQTWLKLCPLIGTLHEPSLIQKKAMSKQYRSLSSRYPSTIRVPKQEKKKMEKELWSFHHAFGIFE